MFQADASGDLTDSNAYIQTKNYTRMDTAWKQLVQKIQNYTDFSEHQVLTVTGFNKVERARCLKKQTEQIYKE